MNPSRRLGNSWRWTVLVLCIEDLLGVGVEGFAYAQARPNFPGYLDASTRLQVHLHKAFLGSESIQAALNNAVADMQHSTGGGNNP